MISSNTIAARRIVACIAFRHINEANENEREAVLVALVDALPEREARAAQDALFALREARRTQLTLAAVLEGIDATRGAKANRPS